MSQSLTSLIVGIFPSLVVAICTAIITVRLSLRRFRAERWWERKADTYSRIVEALHNAMEYCEAMSDESLTHNVITPERKAQLIQDYRQATLELRKATGVGAYIISPEIADALARSQARPELDWQTTAPFEFYDHEREGYKAALGEVRELAKQDLEVRSPSRDKITSWLRLATALSVFWLVGCGIVALIEFSLLPAGRDCTQHKESFEAFFQSRRIPAVYVRQPQLGVVSFPSTMSRPEILDALRRSMPRFYEPTNASVEWDVQLDKPPSDYYCITFDWGRLLRIAVFPSIAIFIGVLAVGYGTRWVSRGFRI